MRIKDIRHWFTSISTSGIIRVDGVYFCFSLEDVARPNGVKVDKQTCIPPGEYKVVIDWSERFQRLMPHLLNVPMFSGIRFHPGNDAVDTEGCPLVGYARVPDKIYESRRAFDDLFSKVQEAIGRGEEVIWEVINEPI